MEQKANFTEAVKEALKDNGWEIYPLAPELASSIIPEWWWIPAKHKNYWKNPKNGVESDNFIPLDQAISWQMMLDKDSTS